MSANLSDLVGRTIVEVRRSADDYSICLVDSTGEAHYFVAEGECCAHAYVEAVESPEFLLGRVTAVSEDDAPRQSGGSDDALDVTFYRLSTAAGTCTIELRVEHNGYYGGCLERRDLSTDAALAACPVVLAPKKGGAP